MEIESLKIMKQCPRFEQCCVPNCPLDLLQEQRAHLKGEALCPLSKTKRHQLGKDTALPRQGLTKREWAAHQRWKELSASDRLHRTAGLRPFRRIVLAKSDS